MAGGRSFEDLEAWKRGFELTREIYRITAEGPIARDFGLRDRMRKTSVAVIAGIAQGFERQEEAGFLPFLGAAKGALAEVKALILLARDLEYLTEADFGRAREAAEAAGKVTGGLYRYLKRNPGRGGKGKSSDLYPGEPDGKPDAPLR